MGGASFDKVVLVTRKTRLDLLVERFNTRAQAKFYLEHAGLDFGDAEREHATYQRALELTRKQLEGPWKLQVLDRALVPTYLFGPSDAVVVLGQDGTVANVAKYVGAQPVLAANPDPARYDGVLLPFSPGQLRAALEATALGRAKVREVTLAEAVLSDGQRLKAFNDLFIGARTHVSAHYRVSTGSGWERQSSSGLIVSTGAGSTGWLSSVCAGAAGVARALGGTAGTAPRLQWEDPRLFYVVREPFVSKHSTANAVAGWVAGDGPLQVESLMPSGGVIFGDGMEEDALGFTSGLVAKVGPAQQRARLVVG
jgi:NAD kinase